MTAEPTTDKYAICLDCGVEHEDREAMLVHGKETSAPVDPPEHGVVARGHRSRVVNPTPEEVQASHVRYTVGRAIQDAVEEAYEDLDREIRRGGITKEEVDKELRGYPDFSDGWDEWWDEGKG